MATSQSPAQDKLSRMRACYDSSMSYVSQALHEDESGNKEIATKHYVNALKFLEEGVRIDLSGAEFSGSDYDEVRDKQKKMLSTHEKVKYRLYDLQEATGHAPSAPAEVPAYSTNVPEGHLSLSSGSYDTSQTVELMVIPSGVQMFFVSSDQQVATTPPSYPTSLRVIVRETDSQTFLHVGDWVYPLNRGETPTLKMSNGAYVFPNRTPGNQAAGSAIGIVISSEVDSVLVETFDNILENLAAFRKQTPEEDVINLSDSVHVDESVESTRSTSDVISDGLVKGSEWISHGLHKGAEYASGLVKKGSEKVKENMTPNDDPSSVNPTVQKGLYYTHEASKATVKVTRFLVDGLCAITTKVGQELAPHIKDAGNKILPSSVTAKDKSGESMMDGVVKVAGAGLSGLGTVWIQLEQSGIAIARAVSSATVDTVQFKYGQEAGRATGNAMGSVVNVGKTAFNLDHLGIKAIAKRTAKDAGKAVLNEYSYDAKTDDLKDEKPASSKESDGK